MGKPQNIQIYYPGLLCPSLSHFARTRNASPLSIVWIVNFAQTLKNTQAWLQQHIVMSKYLHYINYICTHTRTHTLDWQWQFVYVSLNLVLNFISVWHPFGYKFPCFPQLAFFIVRTVFVTTVHNYLSLFAWTSVKLLSFVELQFHFCHAFQLREVTSLPVAYLREQLLLDPTIGLCVFFECLIWISLLDQQNVRL